MDLPVGRGTWAIDIPPGKLIPVRPAAVPSVPTADPRELVRAALEAPFGFEPLRRALTPDDRVVVVFTSGNPIRLATAHVLGLPSPGHMPLGSPDNCSLTTFRIRDGRGEVLRYNHDIAPARPADQREIS